MVMQNPGPEGKRARQTADQLLPLVYEELRHLAVAKMANQPSEHTLQPTALVHEAYLKLVKSNPNKWEDSRHFFSVAARAMQQILVDWARQNGRIKRGSGFQQVNLEEVQFAGEATPESILALNEALEAFAIEYAEKAELVRIRFFSGLSLAKAADAMGISPATATRHMAFARAWLYRHITSKK